MQGKAFILFRKEKEKQIFEILNSELDVERQRKKINSDVSALGVAMSVGGNYMMWQLSN